MIHFEKIIVRVWPEALSLQLNESEAADSNALRLLADRAAPSRSEAIRDWLQAYQVFQGIDGASRLAIASKVLEWADSRDPNRNLSTVDAIIAAHAELAQVCIQAYGEPRDFTSLASKALWLCYPDYVPIFDSFVRRALWVISKLELNIAPPCDMEVDEYRRFVYVWKALYDRYAATLNDLDVGAYPYRVRIFDKILWLMGEPRYGFRF